MKLGFITTFDINDVHKRSGTPFYMAKALEQAGIELDYIDSLKTKLPANFKWKRFCQRLLGAQENSSRFNTYAMKHYAAQIQKKLIGKNVQALVAHILNPIAYLDCKEPIVLWTDAVYASLIGFYQGLSYHSAETIVQANQMTRESLSRCRLAIFSSDWAAHNAIELYGADKDKIKVVPFGANIECNHTLFDIQAMLKTRSRQTVKLLFLGKEWERKGGETVLAVAKALHAAGHTVELNLIGCQPPATVEIPSYVNCLGYISKRTPEGIAQITQLLRESHFLFVPSRAEAFGIVFCEANAFGLPCLTSYVGGISTIVKDNVNGMTFSLGASPQQYCEYIMQLMQNYSRYEELALSSFNEYEKRLNWNVATQAVKQLIKEM